MSERRDRRTFSVILVILVVLAVAGASAFHVADGAAASATPLRINMSSSDVDYVDPALAYYSLSWQLLYPVCAKLFNYPDRPAPEGSVLQPEVADGFPTISNGGKTYTFKIRNDFTFSSGEKVTAQTFKFVIDRLADPVMQSPALPFIQDIVGAIDANGNSQTPVSGVVASGDTLTITLTHPAADFLSRLTMSFFCALPTDTPTTSAGVNSFAGAGPYYIESRVPNGPIVLKRNPYYTAVRPHYFDEIDYVAVNTNPDTSYNQVLSGQIDYDVGGLPPTVHAGLYDQYGPGSPAAAQGRQRYFVNPEQALRYLALNTTTGRPLSDVLL